MQALSTYVVNWYIYIYIYDNAQIIMLPIELENWCSPRACRICPFYLKNSRFLLLERCMSQIFIYLWIFQASGVLQGNVILCLSLSLNVLGFCSESSYDLILRVEDRESGIQMFKTVYPDNIELRYSRYTTDKHN